MKEHVIENIREKSRIFFLAILMCYPIVNHYHCYPIVNPN